MSFSGPHDTAANHKGVGLVQHLLDDGGVWEERITWRSYQVGRVSGHDVGCPPGRNHNLKISSSSKRGKSIESEASGIAVATTCNDNTAEGPFSNIARANWVEACQFQTLQRLSILPIRFLLAGSRARWHSEETCLGRFRKIEFG